jgi:hypothetical protein
VGCRDLPSSPVVPGCTQPRHLWERLGAAISDPSSTAGLGGASTVKYSGRRFTSS